MWSMLKTIVGAVVLGILAYAAFFVDLGGKTFVTHAQEVWRAPVMREKVELVREGVKRHLEDKLAEAGAQAGRQTAGRLVGGEVSDADRRQLEAMLEQVADSAQPRVKGAGSVAP